MQRSETRAAPPDANTANELVMLAQHVLAMEYELEQAIAVKQAKCHKLKGQVLMYQKSLGKLRASTAFDHKNQNHNGSSAAKPATARLGVLQSRLDEAFVELAASRSMSSNLLPVSRAARQLHLVMDQASSQRDFVSGEFQRELELKKELEWVLCSPDANNDMRCTFLRRFKSFNAGAPARRARYEQYEMSLKTQIAATMRFKAEIKRARALLLAQTSGKAVSDKENSLSYPPAQSRISV